MELSNEPAALPDPEPVDLTATGGGPSAKRLVPAAGLLAILILVFRAMRKRS